MILYPEEIKKPEDMECYFLIMLNLVENRKNRICLIQLEGILKMHTSKCKEDVSVCPCSILIDRTKKSEIEICTENSDV